MVSLIVKSASRGFSYFDPQMFVKEARGSNQENKARPNHARCFGRARKPIYPKIVHETTAG